MHTYLVINVRDKGQRRTITTSFNWGVAWPNRRGGTGIIGATVLFGKRMGPSGGGVAYFFLMLPSPHFLSFPLSSRSAIPPVLRDSLKVNLIIQALKADVWYPGVKHL